MKITNANYKVDNWVNVVHQFTEIADIDKTNKMLRTNIPGAIWHESISVSNRSNSNEIVKTPWNFAFHSNGTTTTEFFYGKDQRTQLRNFINTDAKFYALDETQHGNIGSGAGYQMCDWLRFITHNKLTGEQGWYNIPNGATNGDLLYETGSTSWKTKCYYDVPSDSKIEDMKSHGLVSEDYCIHEVFPKVKRTLPGEKIYTPNGDSGEMICSTFAYQRTTQKDLNQYANWHSCMWIKRANHDQQIYRKGSGRNYLVALKDIEVLTPDRRARTLNQGRPISFESPYLILKKEDSGFILHVHQIHTTSTV